MLAAADFDTQGLMKAFAVAPTTANRRTLMYFLRRTMNRLNWEAVIGFRDSPDMLEKALPLRLGVKQNEEEAPPMSIKDMTDEQRVALYVDWCKAIGVDITAEQLLHPEQSQENSNGSDANSTTAH